jgi:hypothetical protein
VLASTDVFRVLKLLFLITVGIEIKKWTSIDSFSPDTVGLTLCLIFPNGFD